MNLRTVFFIVSLLLSPALLAHENQWYFEFGLGRAVGAGDLNHVGVNSNNTPSYDIRGATTRTFALGYQTVDGWRIEFDLRDRSVGVGNEVSIPRRPQYAFLPSAEETLSVSGRVQSTSRMVNIAYVGTLVKPDWKAYVKLGAGESKNRLAAGIDIQPTFTALGLTAGDQYPRGSRSEFAWSAGTGFRVHLRDNMEMGFDYQYSFLGEAISDPGIFGDRLRIDELGVHELSIAVRFHF